MTGQAGTALVAAVALISLALGGCGSTGAEARSAAEDVPALGVALDEVDDAMVARDYGEVRRLLRQLIADVRRAQAAGDLEEQTATDIVAAARRLLAELVDRGQPSDEATPTPDVEDTATAPDPSATPTDRTTSESSPAPTAEPTPSATEPTTTPSAPVSPSSPAPTPEPTPEVPDASKPAAPASTASP